MKRTRLPIGCLSMLILASAIFWLIALPFVIGGCLAERNEEIESLNHRLRKCDCEECGCKE